MEHHRSRQEVGFLVDQILNGLDEWNTAEVAAQVISHINQMGPAAQEKIIQDAVTLWTHEQIRSRSRRGRMQPNMIQVRPGQTFNLLKLRERSRITWDRWAESIPTSQGHQMKRLKLLTRSECLAGANQRRTRFVIPNLRVALLLERLAFGLQIDDSNTVEHAFSDDDLDRIYAETLVETSEPISELRQAAEEALQQSRVQTRPVGEPAAAAS